MIQELRGKERERSFSPPEAGCCCCLSQCHTSLCHGLSPRPWAEAAVRLKMRARAPMHISGLDPTLIFIYF